MRCFRMRGKKGEKHRDPTDPPRRRANKQRGHGTYENDRPPIIGTVGRESGQVRLRVAQHTDSQTLKEHRAQFTRPQAVVNTDEGTITSNASASRSSMATTNGRAMMMAMAAVRFT